MSTLAPPSASTEQQLEMYFMTPAAIIADTKRAASSFLSLTTSSRLKPGCAVASATDVVAVAVVILAVVVREGEISVELTVAPD